jgi:8-amino-7-oxononanoate synthase
MGAPWKQGLAQIQAQGLERRRRLVWGRVQPQLQVSPPARPGEPDGPAQTLLAFCSNDYLGLAAHPELAQALAEGAALYGAGSGASHLISGHHQAHAAFEREVAHALAPHFGQAPVQALSFSTGYMANLAVLTALGTADAVLLCEALNHASLIDGARLSRARVQVYPHQDLQALQAQLGAATEAVKLIVTDSVFSMDGHLAPLASLLALAEAHDAWLVVDDAHGFGVLGAQGLGALEALGLCSERLIYVGTLGKAAGLAGAFVVASADVVAWMVNRARPYIYTTAAPPALAHALSASLRLIRGPQGQERRSRLQALCQQFRQGLQGEGRFDRWALAPSDTAIQALVVGENATALSVSAALEAQGLWVPAIRPPTVPEGTARLRITLSAAHEPEQVCQLLQALQKAHAQT